MKIVSETIPLGNKEQGLPCPPLYLGLCPAKTAFKRSDFPFIDVATGSGSEGGKREEWNEHVQACIARINQAVRERTPPSFTWSTLQSYEVGPTTPPGGLKLDLPAGVPAVLLAFGPSAKHSISYKSKRKLVTVGDVTLLTGPITIFGPGSSGDAQESQDASAKLHVVLAHDAVPRDGVSCDALYALKKAGFRIVSDEAEMAWSFGSYYNTPNPVWEKQDSHERESLLSIVKKHMGSEEIATKAKYNDRERMSDFWHRGDRWVYGIHLEPRNYFEQPPYGLDIDYKRGVTLAIQDKPPHRVLTILPEQQWEWLRRDGKLSFHWRGISIYPRVRALTRGTEHRRALDDGQCLNMAAPVLVEACCEEGSLLSRTSRWSRTRKVLCITEEHDFTSRCAINLSKARIICSADAIWLSCPCTGGSSWVFINWLRGETCREKIREHWDLFHRIWKAFEEVAEHALSKGAKVFIEWPRGCAYWREPCVVRFLAKHNFQFADFDGCMYGLKASGGRHDGMPINKPWRVACSPNSSLPKFLNLRCDRSHTHTACQGSYTKKTQNYTPAIARQVHRSLNYDARREGWPLDAACSMLGIEVSTSRFDYDPSQAKVVQTQFEASPLSDDPPICAVGEAMSEEGEERRETPSKSRPTSRGRGAWRPAVAASGVPLGPLATAPHGRTPSPAVPAEEHPTSVGRGGERTSARPPVQPTGAFPRRASSAGVSARPVPAGAMPRASSAGDLGGGSRHRDIEHERDPASARARRLSEVPAGAGSRIGMGLEQERERYGLVGQAKRVLLPRLGSTGLP